MTKKQKEKLANLLMWMDLKIYAYRDRITADGLMAICTLSEPDFDDDKKRHDLIGSYLDELREE